MPAAILICEPILVRFAILFDVFICMGAATCYLSPTFAFILVWTFVERGFYKVLSGLELKEPSPVSLIESLC